MTIDSLTSVAFTVKSNPGTYAVLLGSGVSSGAGIPTGWSIVMDLVRRLARLRNEDPDASELERWYVDAYGAAPEYSDILEELTATQAERQGILRSYIEPTEGERSDGLKTPSEAHRAIAQLAANGSVRVILTTNFDRLVEQALDEAGVEHDVVASADAIKGARPLVHSPCLVVKLHGDYRDSRIRNTSGELDHYDQATEELLDQVLDNHGLIVCGWSAAWDPGLRAAILRQPNRRYGCVWTTTGSISDQAASLIKQRGADVIHIGSADQFFAQLSESVNVLRDMDRPDPLTVSSAVATLKRLLAAPDQRIRLHDLIMEEAERVRAATGDEDFPCAAKDLDPDEFDDEIRDRVARYTSATEVLVNLVAVGCTWGERDEHDRLWGKALERVANRSTDHSGVPHLLELRNYPAERLMYAGGVAGTHSGRYGAIRSLTTDQPYYRLNDEAPMLVAIHPWGTFRDPAGQALHDDETNRYTPVSDHLHDSFRDSLRQVIPGDRQYTTAFDRFEFLLAMILIDLQLTAEDGVYIPRPFLGSWAWRNRWAEARAEPDWIRIELDRGGQDSLLGGGLFGGSSERASAAFEAAGDFYDSSRARLI